MTGAWYTLRALAREWNALLGSAIVTDVFSASRGELTLLLDRDDSCDAIRISVKPGDLYIMRQPDATRPRRNVTTLLPGVVGRTVQRFEIADRDRLLDLSLSDDSLLRIVLYGPRANVLHARASGEVIDSFRERLSGPGSRLPVPVSAPDPVTPDEVRDRWPGGSMDLERAISRVWPLLDPLLAGEVAARADLPVHDACLVDSIGHASLASSMATLRADLEAPRPVVYRRGREPVAFSLVPLKREAGPDSESFATVDQAVRVFVRADLAQRAYRSEYDPLARLLETVEFRNRTRVDLMLATLVEPSRADRWERHGHLLMAYASTPGVNQAAGRDEILVPDLFEGGPDVPVRLDPSLPLLENAQALYDRARTTRRAREEAEKRLSIADETRATAERLLGELAVIADRDALKAFRTRNEGLLARFAFERPADAAPIPFRRFDLGHGYEAWVGRSARENDELTFTHARKHDWWLHARGVPGSHVVLRNPRRGERPPASVVETAAAIAARYSKAAGSEWVPVILVERRYVRKPRGADPGAVVVEREEVLLVRPLAGDRDG